MVSRQGRRRPAAAGLDRSPYQRLHESSGFLQRKSPARLAMHRTFRAKVDFTAHPRLQTWKMGSHSGFAAPSKQDETGLAS
jgi:hypothetical protein